MASGGTGGTTPTDCFGPALMPPKHNWPSPFPSGSNTNWLVIPYFWPMQVGAEWEWNDSRDENRGVNDDYIEDGSTDKNGVPLLDENGEGNPLAGDAYSYASDPDSFIAYWERLHYPKWKYPSKYKKTTPQNATVSWEFSAAVRTGGWERVKPYPCLGPPVQDEDTGNYYIPVYTKTNPAPTVNPESEEADELYYDNGYKAEDNRFGYGMFVEHSIRYAEVPDDLTDYDLGVKPTWIRPFLGKFVKYNNFNWQYGNGHNGFEIHKDHYDEYDVSYGDGEDGQIVYPFLVDKEFKYLDYINYSGYTKFEDTTTITPVAQVYGRPRHKKYLGVETDMGVKIARRETLIIVSAGNGPSLTSEKYSIKNIEYSLSYGSEHIYEFDPLKPYDSDPDRDATTPPPDYATWPDGSVENVKYEGYVSTDPNTPYGEVFTTTFVDYATPFTETRAYVNLGDWDLGGMVSGIVNRPWTAFGPPSSVDSFSYVYSNTANPPYYSQSRTTIDEYRHSSKLTKFKYYGFMKIGAD